MAGNGVRIFDLQGIEKRIGAHGVVALFLGGKVGIVGQHTGEQRLRGFLPQRGGVALQHVQQHLHLYLLVPVVREREAGIGEMQAVPLLKMLDPHQLSHIAISNVVRSLQPVQVMVPHNHEPLSPHQPLLMIEDGTADAGIVPARPFVGAAEHHDLVLPVLAIGV